MAINFENRFQQKKSKTNLRIFIPKICSNQTKQTPPFLHNKKL